MEIFYTLLMMALMTWVMFRFVLGKKEE